MNIDGGGGGGGTSSSLRRPMPRMQAFAVGSSSSNGGSSASSDSIEPPSAKRKQIETRQRQLDSLKRMEERIKSMQKQEPTAKAEAEKQEPPSKPSQEKQHKCCPCHKMSMFVLDISKAISDNEVEWLQFYSNNTMETPQVAILYSLVQGRGELIMFGGLQKDVASMRNQTTANENDSVTNALYFLTPPSRDVC